MNHKLSSFLILVFIVVLVGVSRVTAQDTDPGAPTAPLSTAFTYQGRLVDNGIPADTTYDFIFTLWNAPSGGLQVGMTMPPVEDLLVSDGYLTVQLDFGVNAFVGEKRWLEVSVRPGTSTGSYTVLTPRQELTAAPYALFSSNAGSVPWGGISSMPAGFADGIDNDTTYAAGSGLTLSGGQFSVNTSLIQARVMGSCAAGSSIRAINVDGTVACETDDNTTTYWSLTGNAGTTPSTNYLGTSDNQPLEIKVYGARALRLEPTTDVPNLVGGYSGNWVTNGVRGAMIGGGGESFWGANRITDLYGTVGGGAGNQAGDNAYSVDSANFATVGGGLANTASSDHATAGGGWSNTASDSYTTVAGGAENTASGYAATIGGGSGNTAGPGVDATVPGGGANEAAGDFSFAAGQFAHALHDGSFVWADATDADFSSTAANQFAVRATGGITLTVDSAGSGLRIWPSTVSPNLVGGYSANTVGAGLYGATIAGGGMSGSTCGESGTEPCWNQVTGEFGTISGGYANTAGGYESTVAGGLHNRATGNHATVGGGNRNTASGVGATVGGGLENRTAGYAASIGGGEGNQASGSYATVPGGYYNLATGQYSFAAGRNARAQHDGSFVWADSTGTDFSSTAANQFAIRANYGVKIVREANAFSFTHAALQVDQGGSYEAAWFYNANANNNSTVIKLLKQPAPGSVANFIEGGEWTGSGNVTRKFHIDASGTYVTGSDFAEALPVAGDLAAYEPGDVLVISLDLPGGVEKCSQPYDSRVLGVYSTRPGVLGADKGGFTEVLAGEVPVAVLGIVPVKVSAENGPIQPGDLLTTSSTPGHAMCCEGLELCFGRTLGKALEGLPAGQLTGVIQMLVTLQ